MSLKMNFSDSHLDIFPDNLGAVSNEHRKKFRMDTLKMGKRYQGIWCLIMMADYYWLIKMDQPRAEFTRKS